MAEWSQRHGYATWSAVCSLIDNRQNHITKELPSWEPAANNADSLKLPTTDRSLSLP